MRQFVTNLDEASVERAVAGAVQACDALSRADDQLGVTHPPCHVFIVSPNDPLHDVVTAILNTKKPKAKSA